MRDRRRCGPCVSSARSGGRTIDRCIEDRHDIDCSFFSSRLSPFVVAYRAVLLPRTPDSATLPCGSLFLPCCSVSGRPSSPSSSTLSSRCISASSSRCSAETSPFWDPFTRYDSGWYYDIARNGYDASTAVAGGRSNIAFFPVYPMLMRHVGRLFGRTQGDVFLGGILVAWLSFVLAMVALYYLARLDLPRRGAERAVLLTAIFPFAFFFGVAYSESTFFIVHGPRVSIYCGRDVGDWADWPVPSQAPHESRAF